MIELEGLLSLIKDVKDFPKPGIVFKDITPIFESPDAFMKLTDLLVEKLPEKITTLAAIESRGFILASAMAMKANKKVVLLRKPGKLPRKVHSEAYQLEYGTDSLEVHVDSIAEGELVCIVDDILATGGTAAAAEKLVKKSGGHVEKLLFFLELVFLQGREKLTSPHESLSTVE